jgi:hypothetical protein
MNIEIPCETIVRLASLIPTPDMDIEPIFRSLRLENGKIIVTDRKYMAIENLGFPFVGVDHIEIPPALLIRCVEGVRTSERITIICNPMIGYTMVVDDPAVNLHVRGDTSPYDVWYDKIVKPALSGAVVDNGAMACDATGMARFAATAPSGQIVFESPIDRSRPMVVRDIHSYDWCGFVYPRLADRVAHPAATVPKWLGGAL